MAGKDDRRLDRIVEAVERLLPPPVPEKLDGKCFRWRRSPLGVGHLAPAPGWSAPDLGELCGLGDEIDALTRNTERFAGGALASNALLTGPRGCGKTTVVHGVAGLFAGEWLKVVLMPREGVGDLPDLADALARRTERFLVVCDELSFAGDGHDHLAAKSALDGIEGGGSGVLVYATSNRRHLIPEDMSENLAATRDEHGELHPDETTEEKISLSDRFGLWLPVFSPGQDEYLEMVRKWFRNHGKNSVNGSTLKDSVNWAHERGSLNGRIARQFVEARLMGLDK